MIQNNFQSELDKKVKYQPSGTEGTHSAPAMPSTPSMGKVEEREKKTEMREENRGKKEIMSEIVATNVTAIQLPKCRSTGMPTACAIVTQSNLYKMVCYCQDYSI